MHLNQPKKPTAAVSYNEQNYTALCDTVAAKDEDLQQIISQHGYPPMFTRPLNFESLLHIILEQQVSLASAKAALIRLQQTIDEVTPEKVLQLSDETLKACYFSRQKMDYARQLAQALISNKLQLNTLWNESDDAVRAQLLPIKGIGHWTCDVILMMCLHRTDIFPLGDLALVKSMKAIKQLPAAITKIELEVIAEHWRPYRTLAACLLWHAYLQKQKTRQSY